MNGASWNTAYSLMGELAENLTVSQNYTVLQMFRQFGLFMM